MAKVRWKPNPTVLPPHELNDEERTRTMETPPSVEVLMRKGAGGTDAQEDPISSRSLSGGDQGYRGPKRLMRQPIKLAAGE